VRFQVLTAASMKMRAGWDIAPCSLVGVDRRFRGLYCPHNGDETSIYFNETTRHCIPEGSRLLRTHLFPFISFPINIHKPKDYELTVVSVPRI
jgi:hypothetical protein